ncbi:MAG: hypothetical protein U9N30_01020 [Campylobacterota bacterium]|nr:hypothetical protein [Campylobacterota bacterium]
MKKNLLLTLALSSLLFASNTVDDKKEDRIKKQIIIEMEKEKKYAKEQTFYSAENYDFKGSQVNPDSLSSVPHIEVDDLDMDSVYD